MTKEYAFTVLTRLGFVARGLMYMAIAVLVIFLGRAQGAEGALQFLADGLGQWALIVAATGFAAYGLWRLADTAFGIEHPGDGKKALAKRLGAGASGLIHLFLAYQTVKLAIGAARAAGGADQQAQTVLDLPAGELLLGAIGLGIAVAAIAQFVKAASCSFLGDLLPEAREGYVKWLGRLGYFTRGVIFLVVAYFVVDAAMDHESWKAGGTEQVFSWFSRPVAFGLACGLFLFGVYALLEAWYRRINSPDIDGFARRASQRLA